MASNGSKQPYSPSAPPEPDPYNHRVAYPYQTPATAGSPSPYAPIAPPHTSSFGSGPIPPPQGPYQYQPPASSSLSYVPITPPHSSGSFGSGQIPPQHGYGYGSYPYNQYNQQQQNYGSFPPGTHPDVIRDFQMVDRNQNGFIEETELQEALSRNYQKFSFRTLRLIIFLFNSNRVSSSKIGPKEFAEVWSCLGQWRAIFERFD